MKKLNILLIVGLVVGLFLSTSSVFAAAPVAPSDFGKPTKLSAAPLGKPTPRPTPLARGRKFTYKGTVAAVDSASLTLTLKDGSSLNFIVNGDTKIRIPGGNSGAIVTDINLGSHAAVQASKAEDGTLTALRILVIPGKPLLIHRVGTVTEYVPGVSITIQATDGNSYAFAITADTKILPEARANLLAVGSRVTIISRRDVTGGPATAQGIVVHPSGTGPTGVQTEEPKASEPPATESPEATEPPAS